MQFTRSVIHPSSGSLPYAVGAVDVSRIPNPSFYYYALALADWTRIMVIGKHTVNGFFMIDAKSGLFYLL